MKNKSEDLTSFKDSNSFLLAGIAHHLALYRNRLYEPHGITGKQAAILTFLCFNKGKEITQHDIEEEFNLRPSTINSALNYLEAGGFILRTTSKTDARAKIVTETQKAHNLFEVILNERKMEEKLIIQGFSSAEQVQLHDFLHRVINNIIEARDGNS
ncbi:MarR family winged helix-turn-helix transcriptional regulator [Caproiciproducens sp. LBM24188]|nr:MarR family transcriptional regulator [Clostridiales bacterium]